MGRLKRWLFPAAATGVTVGFMMTMGAGPTAPPTQQAQGTANLWIDTNGGTCTRQSSPAAYNNAAACSGPDTAYAAASPGDLILWKAGSYTVTTEIENRAIGSTDVVIQPAPGESVTVTGYLVIKTHDLIIHGGDTLDSDETNRITVSRTSLTDSNSTFGLQTPGGGDSGFEDVTGDSLWFTSDDVFFRYSELGPLDACSGTVGTPHDGVIDMVASETVLGVTFKGNYLHGLTNDSCPGDDEHADLMDIRFGQSTISHNNMEECSDQCIFNSAEQQADADLMVNLNIENNWIGNASSINVQCDGECEVNYNTFGPGADYRAGPSFSSTMTLKANVFMSSQTCGNIGPGGGSATLTYNVFPTAQVNLCGATNTEADMSYVDITPPGINYHISGSTSGVSAKGDPGYCPATDYDGSSRPIPGATTCDAGSDEVN